MNTEPTPHYGDKRLPPRFWAKVEACNDTGCWLWTASIGNHGYGCYGVGGLRNGKSWTDVAHRIAYKALVGEIPPDLVTDHLCRVRRCVNPAHMEIVTNRVNLLRGNGWSGRKHRQTHCIHGHELAGDNLYVYPGGSRQCRICKREQGRRYTAKKRGES